MTQQHVVKLFQKFACSHGDIHYKDLLEAGFSPDLILYPESPEDVVKIMKLANELQRPVYPMGNGTMFLKKIEPVSSGIIISTKKLKKVVEYRPKNMSVEVEAGLTLQELQKLLAKDNIFYPVEPDDDSSTIGGQVAVNGYGRKRYIYSSSRFYVMGMEFVSAAGDLVRVGGRTVKNVSGYDVGQLLSGSWGLFGIITKVTLRLKPLPERNIILKRDFQDIEEVKDIINWIFNEQLSMASLVFKTDREQGTLQLELEGFDQTIELQASEMEKRYEFRRTNNLQERRKDLPLTIMVTIKNYSAALQCVWAWAEKHKLAVYIQGNITNGVLEVGITNSVREREATVEELRKELLELEGSLIQGNNLNLKENTANYKLLREIKRQVDPNKILVPGISFLKE